MSGSAEQRNSGIAETLHVFCPAFHETDGTYKLTEVAPQVAMQRLFSHQSKPGGELAWHHGWKSIREMMNENGAALPSRLDRKGSTSFVAMKVGDSGIWLKPIGRPDLQNKVVPADFVFVWVERKE